MTFSRPDDASVPYHPTGMPDVDPMFDHLPPRWRTLKRIGVAFSLLLAIAALVRGYAGHRAGVALADAERVARAAGDPWTPADLRRPPLPAETNAADVYRQAFALRIKDADGPRNSNLNLDLRPEFRYSQDWHRLANDSARRYGPMFALARQARELPDCDWGTLASTPTAKTLVHGRLPHLSEVRWLGKELADHALLLHLRGDDAFALDTLRDIFAVARAVDTDRNLLTHLVAIGMTALACDVTADIAPGLSVSTPAAVENIRALLAELEAMDGELERSGGNAFNTTPLDSRLMIDAFRGGAWLTGPVFDHATAVDFRAAAESREYLRKGSAPRDEWPTRGRSYVTIPGTRVPVTALLWPGDIAREASSVSTGRFVEANRRVVMELRMLRVRLALRLYVADRGRWPTSVDDLVPDYLASVPRGPHRPDVSRVEFVVLPNARPDGADRPMVYVDLYHGGNDVPAERTTGWHSQSVGGKPFDERGRQWRDADVWPVSAYPAAAFP